MVLFAIACLFTQEKKYCAEAPESGPHAITVIALVKH